jgi:hypothetical protein
MLRSQKEPRTIRPGLRVRVPAFHGVQRRVTLNNAGAVLALNALPRRRQAARHDHALLRGRTDLRLGARQCSQRRGRASMQPETRATASSLRPSASARARPTRRRAMRSSGPIGEVRVYIRRGEDLHARRALLQRPDHALNNRAFRSWPLADEIYPAIPSPGGAVSGAKTSSASSMT